MTPQEMREMIIAHDRAITTMQTYFKIMVGFAGVTLPMLVYLVIERALR